MHLAKLQTVTLSLSAVLLSLNSLFSMKKRGAVVMTSSSLISHLIAIFRKVSFQNNFFLLFV